MGKEATPIAISIPLVYANLIWDCIHNIENIP